VDLLALDRSGALVVIELKRTEDGGHLTAVGVGCWSRTRAGRRSETQTFVDPAAFFVSNPLGNTKRKLDERFGLIAPIEKAMLHWLNLEPKPSMLSLG